jgi:hypothetical protein
MVELRYCSDLGAQIFLYSTLAANKVCFFFMNLTQPRSSQMKKFWFWLQYYFCSLKQVIIYFFLSFKHFIIILLLLWGVHCDIYKSSYSISYVKSPSPSSLPTLLEYFQQVLFFNFHTWASLFLRIKNDYSTPLSRTGK